MSTKSQKPSPGELLKELETIHASLLPENNAPSSRRATEDRSELAITQERPAISDEDLAGSNYNYLLDIPAQSGNATAPAASPHSASDPKPPLPGQQSLFTESAGQNPRSDDGTAENPFLPQHIKERLEKEKSLYQKEIDAAANLPGINPFAAKPEEEEALIDELVKIYLPRIAEELRKRLKENLQASPRNED